ncbi:hypothetical protein H8M03_07130 [Sphingomonas sabuli]|uniref:Uncharacterized protein n=1 Tax=Sphingomonas sabuli TaxID=2764186 RepID=A0A7G9KZN6_9SPHN|nr:hypothetical protein [Sphingomonas sabuli]QNM81835.1 hypothetical protein H8M03_07130 [Sphingomonas sabuli]
MNRAVPVLLFVVAAAIYLWLTSTLVWLPLGILLGKMPGAPTDLILKVFSERSLLTLGIALAGIVIAIVRYRSGKVLKAYISLAAGLVGSIASYLLLSRWVGVL